MSKLFGIIKLFLLIALVGSVMTVGIQYPSSNFIISTKSSNLTDVTDIQDTETTDTTETTTDYSSNNPTTNPDYFSRKIDETNAVTSRTSYGFDEFTVETESSQTTETTTAKEDNLESSTLSHQTTDDDSTKTTEYISTTPVNIMRLLKPEPFEIPESNQNNDRIRSNTRYPTKSKPTTFLPPSGIKRTIPRWSIRIGADSVYFHPVCEQPKVSGRGWQKFPFWYYNKYSKTCEWFEYFGKEGNGNRFKSRANCELSCVNVVDDICFRKDIVLCQESWLHCQLLIDLKCQQKAIALNKPVYLVCPPAQPMCVESSLRNDFLYRKVPTYVTHRRLVPKECKLPQDIGSCPIANRRRLYYYYNPSRNMCSGFLFTGCEGNSNRFSSMQECMNHCAF